MKTRSTIDARSISGPGSTPETATHRDDAGRRARVRSTNSALLTFGARSSSPSPSHEPAAAGDRRASRASVERLHRWSAGDEIEEVAPGTTLGELMHRERPTTETTAHMARLQLDRAPHERSLSSGGSMIDMRSPSRGSPSMRTQGGVDADLSSQPQTRAPASTRAASPGAAADETPRSASESTTAQMRAARPRSVRALPSGPKIDGMDNVLMSTYNLGDEQLSSITEALGLGPAHPDEHMRNLQRAALARILRGAVYQGPPMPDAASIGQLQFGRGLPPGRREQLVAAANRAGCFMTERRQRGRNGETQNLLQLHFKPSVDYGVEPLASQPDSANFKAVEALAELMVELTAPGHREDGQRFSIESVAARVTEGGSSQVFAEHFAKHTQVSPPRIELVPAHLNETNIRNAWLFTALTAEQKEKLVDAANVTHLQFEERRSTAADGTRCVKLRVFFGGMENWRDVRQALVTGTGGVGKVFGAARDAAEIIAQKIDHAQREGYRVEFEHIAGASMGGATAQLFAAALQSRVRLQTQPPLVLLDPKLPNTVQLRHAVKGGTLEYDYEKLRGVAVTLDYPANPRKGLMGRMKGLGFKSPGLVRLKLALSDYDGKRRSADGDIETLPPQPSGPPGMGYHADPDLYLAAINRFTRRVDMR
ncbi:type III effector protein [Burkholderia sp. BCC1998]|uniref:type III effector protein n=1 Tax=Burkholderia sp. BCC1998 TaxID=2817447 RepID=UPI002AB7D157|nr:type III effector protein [Burkholderia sp. BCC1998]